MESIPRSHFPDELIMSLDRNFDVTDNSHASVKSSRKYYGSFDAFLGKFKLCVG